MKTTIDLALLEGLLSATPLRRTPNVTPREGDLREVGATGDDRYLAAEPLALALRRLDETMQVEHGLRLRVVRTFTARRVAQVQHAGALAWMQAGQPDFMDARQRHLWRRGSETMRDRTGAPWGWDYAHAGLSVELDVVGMFAGRRAMPAAKLYPLLATASEGLAAAAELCGLRCRARSPIPLEPGWNVYDVPLYQLERAGGVAYAARVAGMLTGQSGGSGLEPVMLAHLALSATERDLSAVDLDSLTVANLAALRELGVTGARSNWNAGTVLHHLERLGWLARNMQRLTLRPGEAWLAVDAEPELEPEPEPEPEPEGA